jgi:hypothetical protein
MSVATQQPETKSREIAPISQPDAPAATGFLVDTGRFEHLWRIATCFAKSDLVPDVFKRKPDNCFIAAQLSLRLGVDLFALMQNLYIVHGKPGFESKLVIGLLNGSNKTIGPVRYRFSGEGDDYGCEAVVVDAFTEEELVGPKVDWKTVKAEGWNKPKKSEPSKWQTMPELMFRYRAAMFLARAHYPEVMLGIQTRDELEDSAIDAEIVPPPNDLEALTDRLEAEGTSGNGNGEEAAAEPQPDATEPAEAATDAPVDDPPAPDDPRPEFLDALAGATTLSGVDQVRREWRARWQTAIDMAWAKVKAEERKEQIRPKEEPRG